MRTVLGSPASEPPSIMRALVFILALLAAAKFGAQEYMFHNAATDVIVTAYKARAIDACQKDPKAIAFGLNNGAWMAPSALRLVIGKASLDVYPWQFDHGAWNARYRNPYLFVTVAQSNMRAVCEYDIVQNATTVQKL
jgi:hypothetical protein